MRVVVALGILVFGGFCAFAGARWQEAAHAKTCSDAGLGKCALAETAWDGQHLIRKWRCTEWNNVEGTRRE